MHQRHMVTPALAISTDTNSNDTGSDMDTDTEPDTSFIPSVLNVVVPAKQPEPVATSLPLAASSSQGSPAPSSAGSSMGSPRYTFSQASRRESMPPARGEEGSNQSLRTTELRISGYSFTGTYRLDIPAQVLISFHPFRDTARPHANATPSFTSRPLAPMCAPRYACWQCVRAVHLYDPRFHRVKIELTILVLRRRSLRSRREPSKTTSSPPFGLHCCQQPQPLDDFHQWAYSISFVVPSYQSTPCCLALSIAKEMLRGAISLAYRIRLFDDTGPSEYDSDRNRGRNEVMEEEANTEWLLFVRAEVAKRLAHSIIHLEALLDTVATYINSTPTIMPAKVTITLPCSFDLWSAVDAQSWFSMARESTGMPENALQDELLDFMEEKAQYLEPPQLQIMVDLVHLFSRSQTFAIQSIYKVLNHSLTLLPKNLHPFPLCIFYQIHLLYLPPLSLFNNLLIRPALPTPSSLPGHTTPVARGALLHAGQILREARTHHYKSQGEPWGVMMSVAAFRAILVVWCWSVVNANAEKERKDRLRIQGLAWAGEGDPLEITDPVVWRSWPLEDCRTARHAGDRAIDDVCVSNTRVAKWIQHGGPITVFGESMKLASKRSELLCGVAQNLNANAVVSKVPVGKKYAAVIERWMKLEGSDARP
ncbi:hypothetical protein P7C70_g6244, partial [Phenoliferia sp. Uapishka_3]